MNLNKEFLSEIISYLINRGVTLTDVLDTFNERFNTLDAFNNSLKNMPTDIKRGTINNVIEDPLLPKYTLTESDKVRLESVSLSPEALSKVFDTTKENPLPCRKLKSKSGQMLFDVINGKTVIEHLKENGITYTNFDNRIRKNWSVEKACTTPLTKIVKPYTRAKKSEEPKAVIVPDSVKVVDETTPKKTKMMLVNGRMTELDVSDTDLIQSSFEKPVETLETKTETLESESNAEKATKNVTIEPQTETDTDTRVNDTNANSDAIHKDKDDYIEKALKKFVTHSEESKKDKKPKETKSDLTVLELCQKMNMTTHELREMVNCGDFPQPDRGNKWSAKLLKEKGII